MSTASPSIPAEAQKNFSSIKFSLRKAVKRKYLKTLTYVNVFIQLQMLNTEQILYSRFCVVVSIESCTISCGWLQCLHFRLWSNRIWENISFLIKIFLHREGARKGSMHVSLINHTFTMIGDKEQKFPGIAPRAMERIFHVINENK